MRVWGFNCFYVVCGMCVIVMFGFLESFCGLVIESCSEKFVGLRFGFKGFWSVFLLNFCDEKKRWEILGSVFIFIFVNMWEFS